MSRRKTAKSAIRSSSLLNRVIALTFALIVFVGCFGAATVYMRHQSAEAANQIKRLEYRIAQEKRQLAEQGAEITRLTTRDALKQANVLYALGLEMPQKSQIVRVIEDPTRRLYEKNEQGLVTVSRF